VTRPLGKATGDAHNCLVSAPTAGERGSDARTPSAAESVAVGCEFLASGALDHLIHDPKALVPAVEELRAAVPTLSLVDAVALVREANAER
jgi:hypothetical protein